MSEMNLNVNKFPSLTWNFLDINRARLFFKAEKISSPKVKVVSPCIKNSSDGFSEGGIQTGLGKEFDDSFDGVFKNLGGVPFVFSAEENSCNGFAKIEFTAEQNENSVGDFFIHAKENSKSVFVFLFKGGNSSEENFLGARIKIRAEKNSRVHVAFVNLLGGGTTFFCSAGSFADDGALVEITELSLGGGKNYSGSFNHLAGCKSSFVGRSSYIVQKKNFLDMNQVALQTGKNSSSKFEADGVLMDEAKKIWRGTIDFKNGCAESTGDEQEDVLLLSPSVTNKSLPVILCDEENVEGRHGCSIGKLDMKKLFYMQSRGVDEKSARVLLTKAKVSKVSRFVPDENLRAEIDAFVEGIV